MFSAVVTAQAPQATWLDRPLSNWNVAGRRMPEAAPDGETIPDMAKRCALLPVKRSTVGERAVADAGFLPFHMFDRQIVQRDVEIVAGQAGADAMCSPLDFNVFVFVGGQLAGTLSPREMRSRSDGSIGGAIRLSDDDIIAAEFARYAESDVLCCPSGRVTVRYRIDRTSTPPVVTPVGIQPTRR
ncbi:MAG: LppP/LprE family lipoprotein [Vicinamibacterales bacterium]